MKRRDFIKKTSIGILSLSLAGCIPNNKTTTKNTKPNIVLIFTDDQGYGDIGCFGAKGFKTPNLDKMAAEGMRFSNFYVGQAVCCPSRAALMTGCYPQRIEMFQNINADENVGLNPDEETIAEVLKKQNYATACFGKWHLGHREPFLPTKQGFDEFWGLPYSHDMKPESAKIYTQWASVIEKYPPLPLMHNEEIIEENPDPAKLTTFYTEKCIDFIERNQDRPFFAYLPHSMPHVPLAVSDKFKGKSENGLYGDVIMEIDWSVGQINQKLAELGLEDNTLVIFTSDNGPWLWMGNHAGSAGQLREGKATTFDGGHRTPCIMKWPGKIPANSECSEPVLSMDLLPTFAGFADAKLPAKKIDGKDISALMMNKPGAKSPHEAIYFYYDMELQAVRSGNWKLHFEHKYIDVIEPGKDGQMGKIESKPLEKSLYDLSKDPGETTNLIDQHPEVVEKLTKYADKIKSELGHWTKKGKQMGTETRPIGTISQDDRSKFLNRGY